jgi:outer membrane protein
MRQMAIISMLVSIVVSTSAQQQLSLDEAIQIGIERNRALKVSASSANAASAKADEVQSNLLPSVKLDAGYRRLSDVPPFQISVPFYSKAITVASTVFDNYNVHVGVQQLLFTGFRLLNNARAARSIADASELDQQNDRRDLVLNVTAAYWALYQAIQIQQYADENVGRL